MSQDEMQTLAQQIAETLGETDRKPVSQINAIVERGGVEIAQSLLEQTKTIQAQGGMMLPDNSRQRTSGGVFFYLARRQLPPELVKVIFPHSTGQQNQPKQKANNSDVQPSVTPFNWNDRRSILQPLLEQQGVISTVKVTLIGRPGKIDTSHKDLVITTMSHTLKLPNIPKGVPPPSDKPTLYTVYISAKQWKKVEDTIANPDDMLIIEGSCAFDEEIGGMAVYAMNLSSKQIEAQKRQAQQESGGAAGKAKSDNASGTHPPRPRRDFDDIPTPPTHATSTMTSVPSEISQKLTELYASASLFRQKIAAIQSKPAGQQFGLEMTQKLLKNVEDEIAAIEKKYQE